MGKADFAVFVGRFQPVHRAHLRIMEETLSREADRLIIAVGSARSPRSLRNPWTFEQRRGMILAALPEELHSKVTVVPVRDFMYSDTHWAIGLQSAVRQVVDESLEDGDPDPKVKLVGHFKDDSSQYLKWFPQWDLVQVQGTPGFNARDVRADYFNSDGKIRAVWELKHADKLHPSTVEFLHDFQELPAYEELAKEAAFIRKYRDDWKSVPYPVTFVTTDAVVVKGSHVLLIRRGREPGLGKLALPGGFVKPDKSIIQSALEELKEETKIEFPREKLMLSLRGTRLFDHPERDARGRVITHAFLFRLPLEGALPKVKGSDDAIGARWIPLADLPLLEDQFYSDHFHIISSFIHSDGTER